MARRSLSVESEQPTGRGDVRLIPSAPTLRPRALAVTDRPLQFEVIPQVVLIADICHFLRISESSFHRLMKAGDLALRELAPLDSTRRFTGQSLAFEIKRRSLAKSA